MTCTTAVYDLSQILHYPIRVEVTSWDSRHPRHSVSYNDEGRIAEGQFLEPRGLPLFTLEDDAGQRLCDALPEPVSTVAALMPAMVAKRTFRFRNNARLTRRFGAPKRRKIGRCAAVG